MLAARGSAELRTQNPESRLGGKPFNLCFVKLTNLCRPPFFDLLDLEEKFHILGWTQSNLDKTGLKFLTT
jgi:hypothetical protein